MKLENQLSHMGTLCDNFAKFLDEANPAEVHFLGEILYQWDNHMIGEEPDSTCNFLLTIVLASLAGDLVGQDPEVYAYDDIHVRFALLSLIATRTVGDKELSDLNRTLLAAAVPDLTDKTFRPSEWPRPTRDLLKSERERLQEVERQPEGGAS